MNLKAKLSLFRLLLLPVLLNLMFLDQWRWATLLFTLAAISAVISYWQKNAPGEIGSFLDPFASKILVMGLLLTFVIFGSFWRWPFLIFVFIDLSIAVIRWRATQEDIIIPHEKYRDWQVFFSFIISGALFMQQLSFKSTMILTIATVIAVLLAIFSLAAHLFYYIRKLRHRLRLGKAVPPQKTVILANTASRGYKDAYRRHLLNVFARRRQAKIIYLQGKNIYQQVSTKLKGIPHIIIAGGDGSLESALNCPSLHHKSIGFFPLGAGNAYYAYFYRGKRHEYLRSRFQFQEAKLDILQLQWNTRRLETAFATIGFDAHVIHFARERTSQGFLDYARGAFMAMKKARKTYTLHVTIDGVKSIWPDCLNLNFGKVPYYGYGLRSLLGEVQGDDGSIYGLALLNTHAPYWNNVVRGWGLLLTALHINNEPLLPLQGKTWTIESSEPFPLQAGGEFLGYTTKVQVKVKRQQKVLVI